MVLTTVLLAVAGASVAVPESRSRAYTEERPLVYEDSWNLWPYTFLNEQGEADGFSIDLLKLLLGQLKIPYVIKLKPNQEAFDDLRDGKSDLRMGLASGFHDEYGQYSRNAVTLFTQSVVSAKKEPVTIHTQRDLSKGKVIVYKNSLAHHLMEDYGWGENAIPCEDITEELQKMSDNEEGQIVWNTLSLKWLLNKYQFDNLELTPVDMPHGEYKFMSNDPQLLNKLDSLITVLNATDELAPIYNKWFYPERNEQPKYSWAWYVAAAIGLLLLLLAFYLVNYRIEGRRVGRQVQRLNKRLALIMETSEVRIWTYEIATQVFTWRNENGQAAYTYTAEEFAHRYRPEDFERLMEALRKLANKEAEEVTIDIKARDAEDGDAQMRDFRIALSVLRSDKEGRPTIIIGTKRDVTERRQQERRDEEQTLRYWAIFNTPMVDIIFYNKDGILTNINARACKTFKCDRDAVLAEQMKFKELPIFEGIDFHHADGIYVTQLIDLPKNEAYEWKAKACKREGKLYYEMRLMTVYDDEQQMIGLFAIGTDVTDNVLYRDQYRERISRTRTATKELTDYISNINYILSVGGVRLATYSPDTHTLTLFQGINEVQHALTQARCMTLVDEHWKKRAMRMLNSMDNRQAIGIDTDIKTQVRVAGGNMLHIEFHFIPTYDEKGHLTEYFGLCRDITEQKVTEQQLVQKSAKAQEIEYAKNSFLKNMSYEMRTPLNAVVGFAEMFEMNHSPEDEAIFVHEILDNSEQLLNLINSVLFLSRLDAGMIKITKQPVDFAIVFESHCQIGWEKHRREGVKYSVENPYEQLVLEIDDTYLGYVIDQIAANAAQYTPQGAVRARYDYIGRRLLISIEDTGKGIAPQMQQRIFDRFVKGTQTGAGLGLPICKELVELMGGNLEINSEEGLGTTVWITLPCRALAIKRRKYI